MHRWPMLLITVCGLMATHGMGAAAEPDKAGTPKPAPAKLERLDSWAEKMVYDGKEGTFHLTQKVTVIKGSLRVNCKEMIGTVDPKTRQMSRVVAVGDVRMLTVHVVADDAAPEPARSPWRGQCAKLDYDLKGDRVLMQSVPGEPRPRLWRAKGYAEADTIVFFPTKGEYELVGDPIIRGEIPTGAAPAP